MLKTLRYIIILIGLLSKLATNGQTIEVIPSQKTDTLNQAHFLNIKLSPLSLIDVYNGGTYKLGLEYRFLPSISLGFEAGKFFNNFTWLKNIKGVLLKSELRCYMPINYNGTFISFEYFYKEQSFMYTDIVKATLEYSKEFTVQKFVNCYNLRIGKYFSNNHGFVEYSLGIGYRDKVIYSNITEYETDHLKEYGDSQPRFFIATPGKKHLLNIDFCLKMGLIYCK